MPGPTSKCIFCGRFMKRYEREVRENNIIIAASDECTNIACISCYDFSLVKWREVNGY
jgi:hypothetical protein